MDNKQDPGTRWRNWGDHPIVVLIGLIAATIAIITFVAGQQGISPLQRFFSLPEEAVLATPTVVASSTDVTNLQPATLEIPTIAPSPTNIPVAQPTIPEISTVAPSPTPSPLPTPTPNIEPSPSAFHKQTWEGDFNQFNYGVYSMILYIESVEGPLFAGKLYWPDLQNSFTSVRGQFVDRFDDVIEESKWSYIGEFKTDRSKGKWIKFTETELLQGNNSIILNSWYYAHLREDGVMVGVWFSSQKAAEPSGEFTIVSKD